MFSLNISKKESLRADEKYLEFLFSFYKNWSLNGVIKYFKLFFVVSFHFHFIFLYYAAKSSRSYICGFSFSFLYSLGDVFTIMPINQLYVRTAALFCCIEITVISETTFHSHPSLWLRQVYSESTHRIL